MKNTKMYAGVRYPAQVIRHAVWIYHRFTLSFQDAEELLAARGWPDCSVGPLWSSLGEYLWAEPCGFSADSEIIAQ